MVAGSERDFRLRLSRAEMQRPPPGQSRAALSPYAAMTSEKTTPRSNSAHVNWRQLSVGWPSALWGPPAHTPAAGGAEKYLRANRGLSDNM